MAFVHPATLRVAARKAGAERFGTRRGYASGYEEQTRRTLRTSSRLTWLTTTAAAAAAVAYYYYPSSFSRPPPGEGIKHEKKPDLEAPKPVEDRHGDSVAKHAIAAHKNQNREREGVFKGDVFDNHVQEHSRDPAGDFEKKQ